MNQRQTFSTSKYNPKIKLTKSNRKPTRRLHTQADDTSQPIRQINNRSTFRIQKNQKIQPNRTKYMEVYSKFTQKQPSNKKTFKVHTTKPFILNKPIKTQADQASSFSYQMHQRKISATSTNVQVTNPHNKYQIDGVAGKGTFGTVFYGHVRGTGKKVAIKKVLQDKRYKNRQLQILKTLNHSNLLEMKDYFMTSQNDKQYLNVVMDYFPQNLYQTIRKKATVGSIIKIYLYQILRGLMYMDFFSIAHRDMKPHNVLVNPQTNKVVICDFGSAKQLVKGQPNLAYICSRCYRAPQLIFGATDYTCQIDMWSTACILVQMINGDPPFLGDSQIDQLIQIIKIMGTPTKQQICQMNPQYDLKQYSKFPTVKKTEWKNVLKTKDTQLIDLVHQMMQYSPKRRITPYEALKHPYFDQLKNQESYKQLFQKVKSIPELFDFSSEQLKHLKNPQELIPKWVNTNHTSHLSTSNFKNIKNISESNNISLNVNNTKPVGHGYTMSSGLYSRKIMMKKT